MASGIIFTICLCSLFLFAECFIKPKFEQDSNDFIKSKKLKSPFRSLYAEHGDLDVAVNDDIDPGQPLFITPYLQSGKIEEAKAKSRVQLGHRYGHSFAGLFTVNSQYNSNIYFWFFPARVNDSTAPIVVWLQGGPGGSSLFGLFIENGPFYIDEKLHINHRNYSWNYNHSVLYIDNPVGTGFSFTDADAGYARSEADVGADLYNVMVQFYTLFPEYMKNDLYLTGESYAGKYVPALAYVIHKMNKNSRFQLNLKGIALGDGFSDPVSMTNYGDLLYEIGLIDSDTKLFFDQQEQLGIKYIKAQKWVKAFEVFKTLLNGDLNSTSYYTNVTGLRNNNNFLLEDEPKDLNYWTKFINQAKVRKEIHVGNLTFHSGVKVEQNLVDDIMKSVKPWIETILNNDYKVMLYNGQLDIIVAPTLTDNFVKTLQWKGADAFRKAQRTIWRVDGEVAGYVKGTKTFFQVVVRNAGHMVPYDQPKWALDMISKFIQYK